VKALPASSVKALPWGPRFNYGEVVRAGLMPDLMAVRWIQEHPEGYFYTLQTRSNKKDVFTYHYEDDIRKYRKGREINEAIVREVSLLTLKKPEQRLQRNLVLPPRLLGYNQYIERRRDASSTEYRRRQGAMARKGSDETEAVETVEKPSKAKKPEVPEGFIKPVELAKKLEIRPQIVYGWIRTGGLPVHVIDEAYEGSGNQMISEDEYGMWVAERASKKADREAKKAEKAAKKAAAGDDEDIEEIE